MTLDITTHKTILFQMLKDIADSSKLSTKIGFKGGTAAMFYYGLDRFSIDLDFDLLHFQDDQTVFEEMSKIAARHGELKDARIKRFNLFWLISYERNARLIKVEINRREPISNFELQTVLGMSLLVMTKGDMVANKILAMNDRMEKTSRDIYDTWYFLSNRFPINTEIIKERSGMSVDAFITKTVDKLEKLHNNQILTGVGEFLNPQQKDWARSKLKQETIALLKLNFLV